MRERDDMTFPPEEYQRRLSGLRERMEERLLDAVIITDPENIMYLTDYQTTGYSFFQALVVPLVDDCYMVTRKMEESNVYARTWVDKTRPYADNGDAIQSLVESSGMRGSPIRPWATSGTATSSPPTSRTASAPPSPTAS
ncbi:hypothetical protein A7A08_02455 [Methyloligella halotolerans]|uniref:Creatinase N-terminal domain-containing protein n=1 Tax=Methyloligella halotolerans TaxID=1177755 RepID=A0A1E2RWT1_9HYPH|nr:aminopeptidase P family N-terminal domain-containing protein [Methyloligella halotolerans]ODA66687.1 hypothetical protein A7A08_02455 [Methyloligella halotolerans]